MTSVGVIGGGVIGLSAAHALARRGAEVVVLERASCGGAASEGNTGWVTPGLSAPIPAPGVVRQALKWMMDRDSPFLVRPRADPSFLGWCVAFWRASSARRHARGLRSTLRLAETTLDAFDGLVDSGVEFEMHADGLLYLVRDARSLESWVSMYEELHALGFDGDTSVLSCEEVHSLEPAINGGVAGGLLGRRERHVRPETLTHGLCAWLRANGADVREDTDVRGLSRTAGGWRIDATGGAIAVDKVVVAAGVESRELLAGLGARIPLQAAKGYSITAANGAAAPKRPLYLTEIKVGASPFDGAVRLAGTLELGATDVTVDRRRVQAILDGASSYLADWRPDEGRVDWAGLRPLLPDAVPLVDAVPGADGAFVATGHGMLGVTLAPATGEALAPLVLDGERGPALAGLGFDRLAGGRR